MSFVSISNTSHKQKYARSLTAFVRFRNTQNGAGGSFSKKTGFRGKRVDIQIDEETNQIRCREDAEGTLCGVNNGQFGFSKSILKIVGYERISLTLADDGWWYGSYENKGVTNEKTNR
ncbi:UNVERIFIED_ORG: hypothetical protein OKW14_001515 [Pantoea brenneri]|nr:hypothetical protein [Pantoea brenneri]